jgi:chloramphenicol 3-O phosphotransferase
MKSGHVIFLNGTSSSGKTTIAKALQEKLPEPYMYVSIDNFFHMYPDRFLNPTNLKESLVLERLVPAVLSGLHRSAAALAQSGNNVLVDHLLQEDGSLQECVESWAGLDVLFVGVRCPLEIAEQRERERGDRNIGTARYQFERVHIHDLYDLEIDTSLLSVDECVARITERISNKPKESAFQKLAARFMIANTSVLPGSEAG